ncbi:MAG: hypothetical protein HOD92_24795 [Deltaproteobacteria bacterium]|jgi:hypothetical protein|nr:hypothetical protein [Deltaproteobacteria bacterium]MBT4527598.1 hypothetical protein [Deltaproteobacteria bacterium]
MKRLKIIIFGLLLVLVSESLIAATSGYTYRIIERRKKTREKLMQQEQINSLKYQLWQKGFIKRVRCLSVDEDSASDAVRASCFNLPPKAQAETGTNQNQVEK